MQTAHLDIENPQELTHTGVNRRYLQEGVVAWVYNRGLLLPKTACDLIQVSRRDFEEMILPKFGYTTLADSDEEVATELNPPE
jgi:hypothetical protein